MAEDFNPRAPCGARRSGGCGKGLRTIFQSTRPMRGATQTRATEELRIYYFNPRAPCGARLIDQLEFEKYSTISIHAPHAGRDQTEAKTAKLDTKFQSTRPMRGATGRYDRRCFRNVGFQSTRPMRGATPAALILLHTLGHFNPRAPCGARQQKYTKLLYTLLRQKAILRQFHAKRRLLKRFSTYKYRNTFLICSANRMGKICTLPLRTTRSLDLPEGMSACSQSARFCFRTFFPSSKTADYPAPDP